MRFLHTRQLICLLAAALSSSLLLAQTPASKTAKRSVTEASTASGQLKLRSGWQLQSGAKLQQSGEAISSSKFKPVGWYATDVPTTVVAALVKHKIYPDPDFGMNLRSYPGVTYPIGGNFSIIAMPPDSPFAASWWYRKEFTLPAEMKGKKVWLKFDGINYKANIFLNGKQIAKAEDIAGAWRTHEFNISEAAVTGRSNVLAVQVYAPSENDLSFTFVDWNPMPPDKNMGIFKDVTITTSGPVAVRNPAVLSKVDSPENQSAHLTVTATLKNATSQAVQGTLKGRIESIEFSQPVQLAANEIKDVTFDPEQVSQLNISNPRLWWPAQMGKPELYKLNLEFEVGGKVSDRSASSFGIRQVTDESRPNNERVFSINGKKILIRGGGWAPDMLLREDSRRVEDELKYVQGMGLNTIRMEGILDQTGLIDMADKMGILVMIGWPCCSPWEHWPKWAPENFNIAEQSLRDQMYRLRNHPSIVMWLNGSDNPPPPDVEQTYLKVEKELRWPTPAVSSATAKTTTVTGESGMKMTGPYDYIAPSYWMSDKGDDPSHSCNPGGCGGGYMFNAETSMGPAIPPAESMLKMLPKEHLWPIDEFWGYHAGGGVFKDVHVFTDALNARYGTATSLEDYTYKSQLQSYEGVRAMYEAYSVNKYKSTGIIQWMLNNAWPSVIWHLYDFYLRPGGGYFGAKTALEPLHPIYKYDDRSIVVLSSQYQDAKGLKLTTRVLNLDMSEKFSQQNDVDAAADSVQNVFTLPLVDGLSPTYFVLLRLDDASGKQVGSNFYWLSTKPETLDWSKSNWYTTPTSSYADYTALSQLPKVKLKLASRTERKGEDSVTHVTVENPSKSLAFCVRLKLNKGKEEVLPVLWQDNYISLLPGEKREIAATYRAAQLGTSKPTVEVSGWNVQ